MESSMGPWRYRRCKAIEPLIHALKDEDEDFREVAKEALEKINAKKSWELCENFIQIYDRWPIIYNSVFVAWFVRQITAFDLSFV